MQKYRVEQYRQLMVVFEVQTVVSPSFFFVNSVILPYKTCHYTSFSPFDDISLYVTYRTRNVVIQIYLTPHAIIRICTVQQILLYGTYRHPYYHNMDDGMFRPATGPAMAMATARPDLSLVGQVQCLLLIGPSDNQHHEREQICISRIISDWISD